MKNTIFLFIAALFITASVNAQSTVDSIRAKYTLQPMPGALTLEKAFPVLGTYHLTTDSTSTLTVSMDSASKGIVWVEGLPQGKFKAFLKQSPATYRITAQKTESGTSVPEGTLMFDTTTNTLNIALGKAYNEANPAEIFGTVADAGVSADVANTGTEVKVKTKTKTTKSKAKVVFYSATKVDQNTTATTGSLQPQSHQ
ncbi:hypothetical protein [Flavisolibacter ginsengisoli]|jgi:hypothetical protein|uniref:Uncharacterized protein n=1 Tax=Flavisolibacter ginsengisoli DSM 18119 TaxID=1121884 RepID=A0A1M5EU41_9BACT|nr:hypothetical protein [Flavisolibacter ginsengisoli]SHF82740.1 hypothetical protein SAMN02745131_03619 [Flavisolibacter ginsengisoli DSM 18119]